MTVYQSPNPPVRSTKGLMTDEERFQEAFIRFQAEWWEKRRALNSPRVQGLPRTHPKWYETDDTLAFWVKNARMAAYGTTKEPSNVASSDS